MTLAKTIIRKVVLPGVTALGLEKLLLSTKKKSSLVINFHGVRAKTKSPINNRHLPIAEFEKTIAYLAKNFSVIRLTELIEMRRSGKLPKQKTIALTFDDGYLNNFELALPILKKYNVPATFYVIGKCLQDDNFLAWPDGLDLYYQLQLNETVLINEHQFIPPEYRSIVSGIALVDYLKTLGSETAKQVNTLLQNKPGKEEKHKFYAEILQLITAEKLKKYAGEPLLEIGSHSYSHFCMEYINEDEARHELKTSKQVIEDCIGKPITSFAFPDGSYTKKTLELCADAGFTEICAVNYRFADDNNNKNLVSRFSISNSATHASNILRLAIEFDRYGS